MKHLQHVFYIEPKKQLLEKLSFQMGLHELN